MANDFQVWVLFLALLFQCVNSYEVVSAGNSPTKRGYTTAVYDGQDSIFIIGGEGSLGIYNDLLRYNLTSAKVTLVGLYSTGLKGPGVGNDGTGSFFTFGGIPSRYNENWNFVYKFSAQNPDPVWHGNFPKNLYFPGVASCGDGLIYLLGGPEYPTVGAILQYDTRTMQTTEIGRLPESIQYLTASCSNGVVYAFGGMTIDNQMSTAIIKFTPSTGEVNVLKGEISEGAAWGGSVAVGEHVYVVGGMNTKNKFRFTEYNIVTDDVTDYDVSNMFPEILGPGVVYVEKLNRIYVLGGTTQWGGIYFDDIIYIQL